MNSSVNGMTQLAGLLKNASPLVQLIIAVGVVWTGIATKQNGSGIRENQTGIRLADERLDQLRTTVAKQVRSLYDNQNFLFDGVDEIRLSQDRIQTKLEIPHQAATPYPRQQLPDFGQYQQYP